MQARKDESGGEIFSFSGQVSPTPAGGVGGLREERARLALLEGLVGGASVCPALNLPGPHPSVWASVSSPVNETIKA